MPFGLVNAGAIYSAMMTDLLRDMLYSSVVNYRDDTLVFSETFEEHIFTLRARFEVYRTNVIYLKPSKVVRGGHETKFLGWIVGGGRIRADPEKVAVVRDWPTPSTCLEVQQLLGLVNWFHRLLPGFADLVPADKEICGFQVACGSRCSLRCTEEFANIGANCGDCGHDQAIFSGHGRVWGGDGCRSNAAAFRGVTADGAPVEEVEQVGSPAADT